MVRLVYDLYWYRAVSDPKPQKTSLYNQLTCKQIITLRNRESQLLRTKVKKVSKYDGVK